MIKGLTIAEMKEYIAIKAKLFNGNMFMVFDEATLASADFKRYEELLTKKLAFLRTKYAHA